jgi:hypothetical protein
MNGFAETVLPFGRYKGQSLSKIPESYLNWLLDNMDLRYGLDREVRQELRNRAVRREFGGDQEPAIRLPRGLQLTVALRLVEAGRRTLAKQCHPDLGGDLGQMKDVNAVADALSELLGSLQEART